MLLVYYRLVILLAKGTGWLPSKVHAVAPPYSEIPIWMRPQGIQCLVQVYRAVLACVRGCALRTWHRTSDNRPGEKRGKLGCSRENDVAIYRQNSRHVYASLSEGLVQT